MIASGYVTIVTKDITSGLRVFDKDLNEQKSPRYVGPISHQSEGRLGNENTTYIKLFYEGTVVLIHPTIWSKLKAAFENGMPNRMCTVVYGYLMKLKINAHNNGGIFTSNSCST